MDGWIIWQIFGVIALGTLAGEADEGIDSDDIDI